MDKAAISFAILAAVLFIVVFLESIAWVKLWLKTGAALKECKTAIARAERIETSLDEKWAKLTSDLSAVKTEGERAHGRIDAQAESMATWNAKAMAREREEKRRLKAETDIPGEPVALPLEENQESTAPHRGRLHLVRKTG